MENLITNSIFLVNFLCGIIFVITALITLKYPPKTINHLYGYRTKRSMESDKAWHFAQNYSSKKLLEHGLILLIVSVIALPFEINDLLGIFSSIIFITFLTIILYLQTEKKLKNLK